TDVVGEEFQITSPITGRVLRVMQESSSVVSPGAALLELGDPLDLEVVVDVLSSDAVRIRPGQQARFEQWGGSDPLLGVVRLVEPSGFTKVSALGVEEQRVNVVLDFIGSLSDREELGDGYRVEAQIIVWDGDETISVPTGALFRDGDDWAVFVVQKEAARLRKVEVGENNGLRAQILNGLKNGEQVILHPSDQIADGAAVSVRKS
ncbi:MAG: HlyD family efflux transporter periplasmic adaptor subunit, partial [Planctomycetaceae bacterium]|nr:HlyD family efflux transporter periplasmic adaptor subunit [Planctomycetaceae bacterium]